MPNWHTNAIAMHKDNISLFLDEDRNLSFNKICPMPPSLNVPSGSIEYDAIAATRFDKEEDFLKNYPHASRIHFPMNTYGQLPFPINSFIDLQKLGQMYLTNMQKYGASTWYDWCINNWGCKWDASRTEVYDFDDISVITFQTPWAPPNPQIFIDKINGTTHPEIYTEDFDEDYQGVSEWVGDTASYYINDPCIFEETEEVPDDTDIDPNTGQPYSYTYADINIQWDELKKRMTAQP